MTEQEKPESAGQSREEEAAPADEGLSQREDHREPAGEIVSEQAKPDDVEPEAGAGDDVAGDTAEDSAAPTDAGTEPEPIRSGGRSNMPAWTALLLSLVALALGAYQWWLTRSAGDADAGVRTSLAELRTELREDVTENSQNLQLLASSLDSMRTSVGRAAEARQLEQLERQFEQSRDIVESLPGRMQNLEETIANLQGISAGARDAWLTAEAEYYMQLANAQVQLAGNAGLAAFALELADRRIRELADPAYTPVRRQLAEEINALRAVSDVDVEGVSLTLASLADVVQSLPLDEEITPAASESGELDEDLSGAARAWAAVKNAFSDVVRVRRSDEQLRPLLSPDAQYFLRTNISLQLQAARLALLKGEVAIFRQSLDDAEAWLLRYFDSGDQAVIAAIATINEIRGSDITSDEMPDISASLRLFRQQQTIAESDE